MARLKISVSLENFHPGGRFRYFFNLWVLRGQDFHVLLQDPRILELILSPGTPNASSISMPS